MPKSTKKSKRRTPLIPRVRKLLREAFDDLYVELVRRRIVAPDRELALRVQMQGILNEDKLELSPNYLLNRKIADLVGTARDNGFAVEEWTPAIHFPGARSQRVVESGPVVALGSPCGGSTIGALVLEIDMRNLDHPLLSVHGYTLQ